MAAVFFYISGHGFGHASRDIEIINALGALRPGLDIVVRTSAARWLFDRAARTPFTYLEGRCDTGVVQIDSLRLDARETIRRAAEYYRVLASHVDAEVALLRAHDAVLVISDAPPLASAAAHAAGLPSIVTGNFTWDWIYEGYAQELASTPDLVPQIQAAYRHAEAAWRMPLHGGFSTFDNIIDVPFVARHARHCRDDVRSRLNLPGDVPLALFSFGGYGLSVFDFTSLDCLDGIGVIVTGQTKPDGLPRHVFFVDERSIYDAGFQYEDLVGAADVVVTKPGFGIVAECIANGTAMLYTSRGRFVEYDVMVREMPRYLRCEYIGLRDLLAGRWREPLDRLLAAPPPPERPRTDGARVIAALIADRPV